MRRWLPTVLLIAAALCFFAGVWSVAKGQRGFTLGFSVIGMLMVTVAIKETRQHRQDIGSPESKRS